MTAPTTNKVEDFFKTKYKSGHKQSCSPCPLILVLITAQEVKFKKPNDQHVRFEKPNVKLSIFLNYPFDGNIFKCSVTKSLK